MAAIQTPPDIVREIADLLASSPTEEQLLSFRPSPAAQRRARRLLLKLNEGTATPDEQSELDQLHHYEVLMRLVKAKIHAKRVRRP